MRIFVTGATGYVGRGVAEAMRRRGHRVMGLARSPLKAKSLSMREIEPVIGDMREPASYAKAAQAADVLIHCAVEYSAEYEALDRKTLDNLLTIVSSGPRQRTLVYTSGVWLYGNTGPESVDETHAFERTNLVPWRCEAERRALAGGGLVIRPACLYGGGGGLTGLWFADALEKGAATVIGSGQNRWSMVHVDDCAEMYVAAIESGIRGELFNGSDRSRFTVREMAEAASRAAGRNGQIKEITMAEAEKSFGSLAHGLTLDQHIDSSKAFRRLRWTPRFSGFCDDTARYFASWMAARPL